MLVDNGIYVVTIIIYMDFVICTEWVLEYLFSVPPRYNWNIIESGGNTITLSSTLLCIDR